MDDRFFVDGAELTCPACGHVFERRVRLLADGGLDPSVAGPRRAARLNQVVCPACGARHLAQVPLLYHDALREVAAVYLPGKLAADAEDLITVLLRRLFELGADPIVGEYLLEPTVCLTAEAFVAAVSGTPRAVETRSDAPYHPNLREALRWARTGDRELVVAVLEAVGPVGDGERLIEVLNEQPMLLEPLTLAALEAAIDEADAEVLPEVAELLADIAAMLRLQRLDEPDSALDDPAAELPAVVEELLAAADMEAAGEFLEPPDERLRNDALRAAMELDVIEQREGLHEHAVLFGDLVDAMMEPQSPADPYAPLPLPPPIRTNPDEVSAAAVEALLAAPTIDEAQEVLDAYPELITEEAMATLARLARESEAADDETLASHIQTLIGIILVALDDEDEA